MRPVCRKPFLCKNAAPAYERRQKINEAGGHRGGRDESHHKKAEMEATRPL